MAKRTSIFQRAAKLKPKRRGNGKEAWYEAAEREDAELWSEMHKFLSEWARDAPGKGKKIALKNKADLHSFICKELSEFSTAIPAESTFSSYMLKLEKTNVTG